MKKIVILEDEEVAKENLLDCIHKYEKEKNIKFMVKTYSTAEDLINSYDEKVNILFLDIEMPGMNGMEAAKIIREKDEDVIIVFVTNLAQYAIEGYEVKAYDFILKPITYITFSRKIQKICNELEHLRNDDTISVSTKEGIIPLYISSIIYIEVQRHNIVIHMVDKDIVFRGTMEKFVNLLSDKNFLLCNICYLVNLRYVKKIEKENVFLLNNVLRISRSKRRTFVQGVADYFGRNI